MKTGDVWKDIGAIRDAVAHIDGMKDSGQLAGTPMTMGTSIGKGGDAPFVDLGNIMSSSTWDLYLAITNKESCSTIPYPGSHLFARRTHPPQ